MNDSLHSGRSCLKKNPFALRAGRGSPGPWEWRHGSPRCCHGWLPARSSPSAQFAGSGKQRQSAVVQQGRDTHEAHNRVDAYHPWEPLLHKSKQPGEPPSGLASGILLPDHVYKKPWHVIVFLLPVRSRHLCNKAATKRAVGSCKDDIPKSD